jgi:hypothetical protein
MMKQDAMRRVLAAKGITRELAQRVFADSEEKANIARVKHAEAEHEAAFWHRILLELSDE